MLIFLYAPTLFCHHSRTKNLATLNFFHLHCFVIIVVLKIWPLSIFFYADNQEYWNECPSFLFTFFISKVLTRIETYMYILLKLLLRNFNFINCQDIWFARLLHFNIIFELLNYYLIIKLGVRLMLILK